jgi:hypothetical protein
MNESLSESATQSCGVIITLLEVCRTCYLLLINTINMVILRIGDVGTSLAPASEHLCQHFSELRNFGCSLKIAQLTMCNLILE